MFGTVWARRLDLIVNWGSKMKTCSILKYGSIVLVPALLLLTGCALETENSHAYLPDAQSEAAGVYIEQCGACHSVPHPQRLSAVAWKDLVAVMDTRRQERGYPPLTKAQRNKIMSYLDAHAR